VVVVEVVVVEVVVVEVVVVEVVVVEVVEVDVDVDGVVDAVVKVVVGVETEVDVDELWLSVETETASLIVTNEEIFVNAVDVLKVVMVVSKEDSDGAVAEGREIDVLKMFVDPIPWFRISAEDDEDIAVLVRVHVNFMSRFLIKSLRTVILRLN
jgi:hypothetical protein